MRPDNLILVQRCSDSQALSSEESRLNLELWRRRVWAEFRACNLTRGERDVLIQLSHYGAEAWPSHATLAQRARCSVSTVQRALGAGRDLGLVQWFTRWVRNGWRSVQTSNLYRLIAAAGPAAIAGHVPISKRVASAVSLPLVVFALRVARNLVGTLFMYLLFSISHTKRLCQ